MVDKNRLWAEIQDKLKGKVSQAAFKTWFQQTELKRVEERSDAIHFEISVQNSFSQEQLSGRYQSLLQTLFEEMLGKKSTFEVTIQTRRAETSVTVPLFESFGDSKTRQKPLLSESMSFDNFVVGSSNQLAYAAAQAIVRAPGETYNPLFIYGPTAVGKTHLMQAIGNELAGRGGYKAVYTSCEGFTNEFISALSNKRAPVFREKYRKVDCLLLDDVQFLSGRPGLQTEFFHTFNELHAQRKQIILTSDRHPAEIGSLEERLVSRFLGGLTCDISLPDLELKTAILMVKSREFGITLDDDLVSKIVRNCQNTREIEGVLLKLSTLELFDGETRGVLFENLITSSVHKKRPPAKAVVSSVCKFYNIKSSQILSAERRRALSVPRQIIMYLLRNELGMSFVSISQFLRRKDHTTIIHGVRNVENLIVKSERLSSEVSQIKESLF